MAFGTHQDSPAGRAFSAIAPDRPRRCRACRRRVHTNAVLHADVKDLTHELATYDMVFLAVRVGVVAEAKAQASRRGAPPVPACRPLERLSGGPFHFHVFLQVLDNLTYEGPTQGNVAGHVRRRRS